MMVQFPQTTYEYVTQTKRRYEDFATPEGYTANTTVQDLGDMANITGLVSVHTSGNITRGIVSYTEEIKKKNIVYLDGMNMLGEYTHVQHCRR